MDALLARCVLPRISKTVAHVAFKVENLVEVIKGKKIIIEPNFPSEDLLVAFIEVNGAPVGLMEYKKINSKKKGKLCQS